MPFANEFYDPHKILFFDLDAVYDMDGMVQKWHSPEKHPGILAPALPWEGDMTLPVAVVPHHTEDKLLCFYRGHHHEKRFPELHALGLGSVGCLAESRAGFLWTRPELDGPRFTDGRRTNLIPVGGAPCLVMDPHDPDPQRRYKGLSLRWPDEIRRIEDGRSRRCYFRATSPDGIHWSDPVPLDGFEETGDTQGLVWDERDRLFRFTTRKRGYWLSDAYPEFYKRPIKKRMPDGRWIAMSVSPDFETWSPLDNVLVRDPMDELGVDFYCACFFPYGPLYVGFLRRHHSWHGLMDTELVWSHDCLRWNRSWYRRAFLSWGELGEDDWCFGDVTNCKPVLADGQLLIYYETRNHVHAPHRKDTDWGLPGLDARMGVATLRPDGFVSLEAGRMGGSLVTESLPMAGKRVTANIRTVQAGIVEAHLLGADREPLPVDPLRFQGDELALPLCFGGKETLPAAPGGRLSLRLHLQNAALYNLRIAP